MKILIAGCGYLGAKIASNWARDPDNEVFAASRSGQDRLPREVNALKVDLAYGDLGMLPRGLQVIVFCAAPTGSTVAAYDEVYSRALGRVSDAMLQTAAKDARLILTSSTSVYGQSQGELVDEDSLTAPASPTGAALLRAERQLPPNALAIRLGGIYGPGRISFIKSVRDGSMVVNPDRSAFTNRIHRDDAAGVAQFCAVLPRPDRIYNGVDSDAATRATVARWLAAKLGVPLATTTDAETSSFLRGNRRVSNQRLLAAGYTFLFPTFREGYSALINDPD